MRHGVALLLLLAACRRLPELDIQRIAFGSCASQYGDQPIWTEVIAAEPDLFLHLGDAIYADWDGTKGVPPSIEKMKADYAALAGKPEFKRARSKIPFMATWDDHDYGINDGGADFELIAFALPG